MARTRMAPSSRSSAMICSARSRSFSQELRLAGEGPKLNWIVGGYYSRDHVDENQLVYLNDFSTINLLRFVGGSLGDPRYTPQQIAEGFRVNDQVAQIRERSLRPSPTPSTDHEHDQADRRGALHQRSQPQCGLRRRCGRKHAAGVEHCGRAARRPLSGLQRPARPVHDLRQRFFGAGRPRPSAARRA